MGEFFRRVLYGKEQKSDFTDASLPATRREQFAYVIKTRWRKLLAVNLLVFLFSAPLLLWHLLCLSYESSFGNLTTENISAYTQYVIAYKSIPRTIFMGLTGLGLAGGLHAIRMIVWGEPIGAVRAFFRGIKHSYKQFLIGGFFYGIFRMISEVAKVRTFGIEVLDASMQIVAMAALVLSECFVIIFGMFMMALISNYNIKFAHCIKNSILLTFNTLVKTVLVLCAGLLPIVFWFLGGNIILHLIGIVLLISVGFAYSILVWCLYTNSIFDRYINMKTYPDYYRKGLRKDVETVCQKSN